MSICKCRFCFVMKRVTNLVDGTTILTRSATTGRYPFKYLLIFLYKVWMDPADIKSTEPKNPVPVMMQTQVTWCVLPSIMNLIQKRWQLRKYIVLFIFNQAFIFFMIIYLLITIWIYKPILKLYGKINCLNKKMKWKSTEIYIHFLSEKRPNSLAQAYQNKDAKEMWKTWPF